MRLLFAFLCFINIIITSYCQNLYVNISSTGSWRLASIPQKQTSVFPESNLFDRTIGFNRAKICWYIIDPAFFYRNNSVTPPQIENDSLFKKNHLMREIFQKEIYPNSEYQNGVPTYLCLLNLAYYPEEKGPYNYDIDSTLYSKGVDSTGKLITPETRWGGIMRRLEYNCLSNPNLHFVGFWLMDPFVYDSVSGGGDLYIQLGNFSEDVLKDNRISCESSYSNSNTIWGLVPDNISFPYVFNQNYSGDYGLDGLNDPSEISFYSGYLQSVKNKYGQNSIAYTVAKNDPSSDNFLNYRDNIYDDNGSCILKRYKDYNNSENNSNDNYSYPATSMPDFEDINLNQVLDTSENYFQYKIEIKPGSFIEGQNYLTDKIIANPSNGDGSPVTWYKFLVPFESEQREIIGNISNINESGFIRLILKNFSDSVILRTYDLSFVTSDLYDPGIQYNGGFIIFPNPASRYFTIKNNVNITSIRITDLLGRVIYNNNILLTSDKIDLDVSELSNGVYIVYIEDIIQSHTAKLIIQK